MYKNRCVPAGVLIAVAPLLGITTSVRAFEIWYVAPCQGTGSGTFHDPYCTIQAGITAARASSDTEKYVSLKSSGDDNVHAGTGNKNLQLTNLDNNTTIRCGDPPCIIDCEGSGRAFDIGNGSAVTIEALTIRNGSVSTGGGIQIVNSSPKILGNIIENCTAASGGGIYATGSISHMPTISGNTIHSNSAGSGGGLYLVGSVSANISLNHIHDNSATQYGGGLRIDSPNVSVSRCLIQDNTVTLAGNAYGGGIHIAVDLVQPIDRCRILGNSATANGGGIFVAASEGLIILRSEISGNTCPNWGGGIGAKQLAKIHLISCRLEGNKARGGAGAGGGIYGFGAEISIENSVLARNEATYEGGAVYSTHILNIKNSTIVDNVSDLEGGGIAGGGEVTIRNSILWGNTADYGPQIAMGGGSDLVNIAWSNVEKHLDDGILGGTVTLGDGLQNEDPDFVSAEAKDYRTVANSAMNDAGNNEEIPDDTFDFDNNSNTTQLPYDVGNQPRRVVDPQATAAGYPENDSPYTDLGAHEHCREMLAPVVAGGDWPNANRFIGFKLGEPELSANRAVRVRLVSLLEGHEDFEQLEGGVRWVGPVSDCPDNEFLYSSYKCAKVQCSPYYTEWPTDESIYVYGPEIVPASIYHVEVLDGSCEDEEESCEDYSCHLVARTSVWGDVVAPIHVSSLDGGPNVLDISAMVNTLKDVNGGLPRNRALLHGMDVKPLTRWPSVIDVGKVANALAGVAYQEEAPEGCQ